MEWLFQYNPQPTDNTELKIILQGWNATDKSVIIDAARFLELLKEIDILRRKVENLEDRPVCCCKD